ncbi:uncharacterized protein si:dkey-182g1.4 [Danio rerio]|uniref:Uncharacterized protein si:dkey-182g1.4 n=1 Tax=Danio rerio TaxID=7955 RepID=A0A8M2B8L9_DANRE|nr:uncharacterized protein si:dkey-182g1.4 [Danio rerio]|eukprot:XP_005161711.1 uncharacterized protein si:dkey-182g1.4 [Danio rerio]
MRKLIVNMIYALVLTSMCLWHSVDMTEEVKIISVREGDPLALHTDVDEVSRYLLIQWMFENTRIAEVNRLSKINSTYDGPEETFRGRLKLDQTGSLTITNTRSTDSGLYKLSIYKLQQISYIHFQVTIYGRSSGSDCVSSKCTKSNSVTNQPDETDITKLPQSTSAEVKTISVMEGDSVTLHTGVTDVQKYLLIQWMLENTRIAEVNRLAQNRAAYDGPHGRFRDRLKLDETGSLIIINTTTTDSGLYKLTLVIQESIYVNFNLTVYVSSSPEKSLISLMNNQTEDANITDLHQTSSDSFYCCGLPETVIRLVICALVGVVVLALLVYDVRATRLELRRAEETRLYHQIPEVKSELQPELSRKMSNRYVY